MFASLFGAKMFLVCFISKSFFFFFHKESPCIHVCLSFENIQDWEKVFPSSGFDFYPMTNQYKPETNSVFLCYSYKSLHIVLQSQYLLHFSKRFDEIINIFSIPLSFTLDVNKSIYYWDGISQILVQGSLCYLLPNWRSWLRVWGLEVSSTWRYWFCVFQHI